MAIESKNHRPSPVDHVLVSQGTRSDSQPPALPRFDTYKDEQEYWIKIKMQIDADLSPFNKDAMHREQYRIRKEHKDPEKSLNAWMERKAELTAKREQIISRKKAAEMELMRLKPLVAAERNREAERSQPNDSITELSQVPLFRPDGSISYNGIWAQILIELQAIRSLLQQK